MIHTLAFLCCGLQARQWQDGGSNIGPTESTSNHDFNDCQGDSLAHVKVADAAHIRGGRQAADVGLGVNLAALVPLKLCCRVRVVCNWARYER